MKLNELFNAGNASYSAEALLNSKQLKAADHLSYNENNCKFILQKLESFTKSCNSLAMDWSTIPTTLEVFSHIHEIVEPMTKDFVGAIVTLVEQGVDCTHYEGTWNLLKILRGAIKTTIHLLTSNDAEALERAVASQKKAAAELQKAINK